MLKTEIVSVVAKFRVEFRYPHGTLHYKYFNQIDETASATDTMSKFEFGASKPTIYYPTSQQIQVKGPRGGWRKVDPSMLLKSKNLDF